MKITEVAYRLMVHKEKYFNTAVVITLIWQLVIVACIPSITHLIICFGADGHIDISLSDGSKPQATLLQTEKILNDSKEHHDDCVDFELLCDVFNEGLLVISATGSNRIMKKGHEPFRKIKINLDLFGVDNVRSLRMFPYPEDDARSSFQTDFLNTIVLLI